MKRVLIVGGGTAGWIAAAYLNRLGRTAGLTVTLVESVKLGTSGVGEATDPALVRLIRNLRIDEAELMNQCSATYQLGTRFVNWGEEGHEYWHPFGLCGGTINNVDLFHFWLKSKRANPDEGAYSSYSLQALLAAADKAPRPVRGPSPIMERAEYAYHLDPHGGADFFRELATSEGVNHLFDDVRNVVRGESGRVERVETKSGRALAADLVIDCSAEGVVIEQGLGDPWVSWSPPFLCDGEVLLPLPRDAQMPPYVRCTALSAGWVRLVPLSHRVACSYYYSRAHLSDDAAVRELLSRVTSGKAAAGEPRYTKLRQGRRQNFWVGNCVALGPAAGFVEPVEPVDMLLLHRMIEWLAALFPDATMNPALARAYNEQVAALFDTVRDFIHLHYVLSRRAEQPFWTEVRNAAVPESLQSVLALHDENGAVAPEPLRVFPESSWHHLFAGGDRLPRRSPALADSVDFGQVSEILGKMRAQNEEWVAKLPPHREIVERIHRPPV